MLKHFTLEILTDVSCLRFLFSQCISVSSFIYIIYIYIYMDIKMHHPMKKSKISIFVLISKVRWFACIFLYPQAGRQTQTHTSMETHTHRAYKTKHCMLHSLIARDREKHSLLKKCNFDCCQTTKKPIIMSPMEQTSDCLCESSSLYSKHTIDLYVLIKPTHNSKVVWRVSAWWQTAAMTKISTAWLLRFSYINSLCSDNL